MANTVGTPRSLSLNGQSFSIPGDSDVTLDLDDFSNEKLPTTGGNVTQKTRKVQMISGVTIRVKNLAERKQLQLLADGIDDINLSMTMANGDVIAGAGQMQGDKSNSSATGVYTFDFAFTNSPTY